jgi:hypothetical protein
MARSVFTFLGLCLCAFAAAQGETTQLDGNFFAFKRTSPFAIKESGRWAVPRFVLSLGMERDPTMKKLDVLPGYSFVLDATKAGIAVPKNCQQRFSSEPNQTRSTMTLPVAVFDFDDVEQMFMHRDGCAVTVWMSGQRSYWGQKRFENSDIVPPQSESVSHGLVEFRSGAEASLIQFAIPVQDLN